MRENFFSENSNTLILYVQVTNATQYIFFSENHFQNFKLPVNTPPYLKIAICSLKKNKKLIKKEYPGISSRFCKTNSQKHQSLAGGCTCKARTSRRRNILLAGYYEDDNHTQAIMKTTNNFYDIGFSNLANIDKLLRNGKFSPSKIL